MERRKARRQVKALRKVVRLLTQDSRNEKRQGGNTEPLCRRCALLLQGRHSGSAQHIHSCLDDLRLWLAKAWLHGFE